jgi:phosphoribosylglycinamide formyltransferase-1
MPHTLGVLISGRGSNLQAIIDAVAGGRLDARIAVVISNKGEALGLERARRSGIETLVLSHKGYATREEYDTAVVGELKARGVELVCLAGFMRLLTPPLVSAFGPTAATRGCPRMVNIHPALLPAFSGLHAQRQALAHGVSLSGCTVHFVDEGVDTGPIIVQAAVPVLQDDTEESLARRILVEEHRIYPRAVQWFAEGRLALEGRRVVVAGAGATPGVVRWPWDEADGA